MIKVSDTRPRSCKNKNKTSVEKKPIVIHELLKKHHPWLYPLIGAIFVSFSGIAKVIESVCYKTIADYYGIDFSLVLSDENIFYYLSLGILVTITMTFTFSGIIRVIENHKYSLVDFFLSIIGNFFLLILTTNIKVLILMVMACILTLLEYGIFYILFRGNSFLEQIEKKFSLSQIIECLFFYIVIISLLISFTATKFTEYSLNHTYEYRFISESKVIIRSNPGYYITLDCEIESDHLSILKGTQTKIDAQGIQTYIQQFKEVSILYKLKSDN